MINGITEVVHVPDLGKTPASVNRKTGVMYISLKHTKKMPFEHILFMMLHENAHVVLQTTDEVLADEKAFKDYADLGYSLNASIKALTQVLNEKNKDHAWRMYLQLERAKAYDLKKNGNTKFLTNENRSNYNLTR
ncbi:hypothetical protein [Pedobacter cryophilus]|uniref:Uncharacterized protein n=1 Tax=Pedobacter cryophilus TaxID=2571271 RepID=A0A4U1BWH8_9SPHI|nr:hypothetical protein [Pedobacter cryophilus]TKB96852.1 hypothetical protein FA046_12300 [Pedobacter cryophilus]